MHVVDVCALCACDVYNNEYPRSYRVKIPPHIGYMIGESLISRLGDVTIIPRDQNTLGWPLLSPQTPILLRVCVYNIICTCAFLCWSFEYQSLLLYIICIELYIMKTACITHENIHNFVF